MGKKYILPLLIITVMMLTILMDSPTHAQPNPSFIVPEAHRTITIGNLGTINVTDELTIENNGTIPVSSFKIAIKEKFVEKLCYIGAKNQEDQKLELRYLGLDESNYTFWQILFGEPINPGKIEKITVTTVYGGLITPIRGTEKTYEFTLYYYPTIPYSIKDCRVEIKLPAGAETENETSMETWALSPLTYKEFYFQYNYTRNSLIYVEFEREIKPYDIAYIKVTEAYKLKNVGFSNIEEFDFKLPEGTTRLSISDKAGPIDADISKGNLTTKTTVTISFKTGRKEVLGPNTTYTIYVSYLLPADIYLKNINTFYLLTVPIYPEVPALVTKGVTTIILPPHSKINPPKVEVIPTVQRLQPQIEQNKIIYTYYNVTSPTGNLKIKITYIVNPLYDLLRPLAYSMIFAAITAIYIAIRKVQIAVVPPTVEVPVPVPVPTPVVREFCRAYEEKMALMLEIDKLEEAFRTGRIKKKDYKRKMKLYEKELISATKEVEKVKEELRKAAPKLEDYIKRIELLEAERESVKASINQLERSYKTKKITKLAYAKLRRQYEGRLRKIYSNMDKVIFELRETTK
nr:hypothetical protein [Candidatus Baldrarchaeota archaeon]